MTITSYHNSIVCDLDDDDFNEGLLSCIRGHAEKQGKPVSYVVPATELLSDDDDFPDENFVVIALPGVASGSIAVRRPYIAASLETASDGERIACLMLANEGVALSNVAVAWATTRENYRLMVLWLFDDDTFLCEYGLSDDLREDLWLQSKCADSHVFLTDDERNAWKKAAAGARHIGVFEVCDLREESLVLYK